MKKAVDDFKAEAAAQNLPTLFLNAGDTFQGTPYYTIFKWEIAANLLRTLGIDVACLGNHEFDNGVNDLSLFLRNITDIPIVVANINVTLEPSLNVPNLKRSVVLEIAGRKIGIIGYLGPTTKDSLLTGQVIFEDEINATRKEAKRLKSEGVNIVIALGHSGFEKDVEIAREIPEVSLVVGGHTHSLLYSPKEHPPSTEKVTAEYPFMVNQTIGDRKVPVVQSSCNSKYLGKLRIKFDDEGNVISAVGNNILLDSSFQEDEYVLEKLKQYKTELDKIVLPVVGKTNVYLSKVSGINQSLGAESNFGNMVADAYVDYVTRRYNSTDTWTNAAIGLIEAKTIRIDIDNKKNGGNITFGELLTAMPYENKLATAKLDGETLIELFEFAVSKISVSQMKDIHISKLLHFSGIRVVYDMSRQVGHRIKSLTIRCANCSIPKYDDVRTNTNYTIVTDDFLLNGGGNYDVLKEKSTDHEILGISSAKAVAEYIEIRQIIYPGLEERIVLENIEYCTGKTNRILSSTFILFLFPIILSRSVSFYNLR